MNIRTKQAVSDRAQDFLDGRWSGIEAERILYAALLRHRAGCQLQQGVVDDNGNQVDTGEWTDILALIKLLEDDQVSLEPSEGNTVRLNAEDWKRNRNQVEMGRRLSEAIETGNIQKILDAQVAFDSSVGLGRNRAHVRPKLLALSEAFQAIQQG